MDLISPSGHVGTNMAARGIRPIAGCVPRDWGVEHWVHTHLTLQGVRVVPGVLVWNPLKK